MSYQALIDNAAAAHGLPAALVTAVVQVESGGNPWAIRYEPNFYTKYIANNSSVHAVAPCSLATERTAQSTSWGLMQVMGATARGLGFNKAYLSELCDPATGLEFGCRLLAKLRDKHYDIHGWTWVCAAYNAGTPHLDDNGQLRNQEYVDRIANALGGAWPA